MRYMVKFSKTEKYKDSRTVKEEGKVKKKLAEGLRKRKTKK